MNSREVIEKGDDGTPLEKSSPGDSSVGFASSDCSTSSSTSTQKSVSFDSVQIREFPRVLGDHPACIGPALALSNTCVCFEERSVDEFEARRKRTKEVSKISYMRRWNILENSCGYTMEEINSAENEASRIRRQRERTNQLLYLSKIEYGFESLGRKLRRRFGRSAA